MAKLEATHSTSYHNGREELEECSPVSTAPYCAIELTCSNKIPAFTDEDVQKVLTSLQEV